MAEYVYLVGGEQVSQAASSIRVAANDLMHAASTISESVSRLERIAAEYIERLEQLNRSTTDV